MINSNFKQKPRAEHSVERGRGEKENTELERAGSRGDDRRAPLSSSPIVPFSIRRQVALFKQMEISNEGPAETSSATNSAASTPTRKRLPPVKRKNDRGETALHLAARKGDVAHCGQLIADGADVNAVDYAGWTPLHEACGSNQVETARLLILSGANVNMQSHETRDTPLHDAASNSDEELIRLLVMNGADRSLRNSRGQMAVELLDTETAHVYRHLFEDQHHPLPHHPHYYQNMNPQPNQESGRQFRQEGGGQFNHCYGYQNPNQMYEMGCEERGDVSENLNMHQNTIGNEAHLIGQETRRQYEYPAQQQQQYQMNRVHQTNQVPHEEEQRKYSSWYALAMEQAERRLEQQNEAPMVNYEMQSGMGKGGNELSMPPLLGHDPTNYNYYHQPAALPSPQREFNAEQHQSSNSNAERFRDESSAAAVESPNSFQISDTVPGQDPGQEQELGQGPVSEAEKEKRLVPALRIKLSTIATGMYARSEQSDDSDELEDSGHDEINNRTSDDEAVKAESGSGWETSELNKANQSATLDGLESTASGVQEEVKNEMKEENVGEEDGKGETMVEPDQNVEKVEDIETENLTTKKDENRRKLRERKPAERGAKRGTGRRRGGSNAGSSRSSRCNSNTTSPKTAPASAKRVRTGHASRTATPLFRAAQLNAKYNEDDFEEEQYYGNKPVVQKATRLATDKKKRKHQGDGIMTEESIEKSEVAVDNEDASAMIESEALVGGPSPKKSKVEDTNEDEGGSRANDDESGNNINMAEEKDEERKIPPLRITWKTSDETADPAMYPVQLDQPEYEYDNVAESVAPTQPPPPKKNRGRPGKKQIAAMAAKAARQAAQRHQKKVGDVDSQADEAAAETGAIIGEGEAMPSTSSKGDDGPRLTRSKVHLVRQDGKAAHEHDVVAAKKRRRQRLESHLQSTTEDGDAMVPGKASMLNPKEHRDSMTLLMSPRLACHEAMKSPPISPTAVNIPEIQNAVKEIYAGNPERMHFKLRNWIMRKHEMEQEERNRVPPREIGDNEKKYLCNRKQKATDRAYSVIRKMKHEKIPDDCPEVMQETWYMFEEERFDFLKKSEEEKLRLRIALELDASRVNHRRWRHEHGDYTVASTYCRQLVSDEICNPGVLEYKEREAEIPTAVQMQAKAEKKIEELFNMQFCLAATISNKQVAFWKEIGFKKMIAWEELEEHAERMVSFSLLSMITRCEFTP